MLTPEEDPVVDDSNNEWNCRNAPIWCPNVGQKYPDGKPMGYPFNRKPYKYKIINTETNIYLKKI